MSELIHLDRIELEADGQIGAAFLLLLNASEGLLAAVLGVEHFTADAGNFSLHALNGFRPGLITAGLNEDKVSVVLFHYNFS